MERPPEGRVYWFRSQELKQRDCWGLGGCYRGQSAEAAQEEGEDGARGGSKAEESAQGLRMRSRPRSTHRGLLSEHLFGHDIHEPFFLLMIAPLLLQNCFHFPFAAALQFRRPTRPEAAPAALCASVSLSTRCIRLHQSSVSSGSALGDLKK